MKRNIEMYQDIIDLPRPKSKIRIPMSINERAAQFAPFAALAGHDDEIKETARITSQRIELDEMEKELIDLKLRIVESRINEQIQCSICYFIKDLKKRGGEYVTVTGIVKKIDSNEKTIILENNNKISIDDIIDIDSSLFTFIYNN